jgi:PAS domain S-box-containing protein
MAERPSGDPRHAFSEMKRYVRFSDEDGRLLNAFLETARPHFQSVANEFYDRAREHEDAHAVFENEEQIQRLQRTMVVWLERVLSGPYDNAYAEKSARIGHVHVRVGLPQRFMFTAMTLFRLRLRAIAERELGEDAGPTCQALTRILDLELAMMNAAYGEAMEMRNARLARSAGEEALSALERSKRHYVRAVDIAGVLVIGIDAQARVELFNHEAERVTGFAADEVIGQPFADVFLEAGECHFDEIWKAALATSEPVTLPTRCSIRTRNRKRRDIAGRVSRTLDGDDEGTLLILAGRDITEEMAHTARLRRTEKLAAVGTMAAGLAHEIRNPLNGAQLHLTFLDRALKNVSDDPDLFDAITVVSDEISRLSALVNDFLDFARPTQMSRSAVSLPELCQRAAAMVDAHGVPLTVTVPHSDLIAEVDASRLQQVLLNLLGNAVEAVSGDAGSHVELKMYREPHHAVIEVTDDGPGIPASSPIFDAFYSTKPQGTGLGLAIAHRIVDDHGGSIEVDSRPGKTVFRLRLPLTDPERVPASVAPPGV